MSDLDCLSCRIPEFFSTLEKSSWFPLLQ